MFQTYFEARDNSRGEAKIMSGRQLAILLFVFEYKELRAVTGRNNSNSTSRALSSPNTRAFVARGRCIGGRPCAFLPPPSNNRIFPVSVRASP